MSKSKEKKIFKAHINETTGKIQTVEEHCKETADMAREFSIRELKDVSYAVGLMHDLGKFQSDFQAKIDGKAIAVEHSGCGAIEAGKYYGRVVSQFLQLCIAGHHTGIPDCINSEGTSLEDRLKREVQDYSAYKEELEIPLINEGEFIRFICRDCGENKDLLIDKFSFFVRYVFSCLTDADSLNTEEFCTGEKRQSLRTDFAECLKQVNTQLESFTVETQLQKTRTILQKQVYDQMERDSEVYFMAMPTGSGKSLCSVKMALERAIRKQKKRIIYVIPFNSIIDQTADKFSELFGEAAHILRHQSTFAPEESVLKSTGKIDEDYVKVIKQATENWDADFIITTAVQFFESIYGNKRGKLRKLHNMADSILVFDEIHMMPLDYFQPCLEAITYITRYLNSETIFLTATMPDFEKAFKDYSLPGGKYLNLVEDKSLFGVFRRCDFENIGKQSEEAIIQKAREYPTSLIIVNTKKSAKELYNMVQGQVYHLSTYMTAYDRRRVIAEIHEELAKLEVDFPGLEGVPAERRIMVFSTSLIEAGVDFDFSVVFRELAGVDNILQAGGRCNREGKRKNAVTYIFELDSRPETEDKRREITRGILEEYEDISVPEAVNAYYQRVFKVRERNLTRNSMYQYCDKIDTIPFRKYAEQFELIDNRTVSIVVERDEISRELIQTVRYTGKGNSRKLQNYTCSVQLREFEELFKSGVVEDLGTGIYCLTNMDYYDRNLGITFDETDYFL